MTHISQDEFDPQYTFDARNHSPIMIDRLLAFVYTGTYQFDEGGRPRLLHHANQLPPGKTSSNYGMSIELSAGFHPKMYNMGKYLSYPSLMAIAHTKMVEDILYKSKLMVGDVHLSHGCAGPAKTRGTQVARATTLSRSWSHRVFYDMCIKSSEMLRN
jgi:hypothetical protein